MGVDVATFHSILERGFAELWNSTPTTREDVRSHGAPRLQKRSLDAPGGLGFVPHDLNSTMSLLTLQQVFALVPSVCYKSWQKNTIGVNKHYHTPALRVERRFVN
jgi:hypothetical protein